MVKYMTKCKCLGEIAVMEVAPVGVMTRARALAFEAAAAEAKRRKVVASTPYVQPKSKIRRCDIIKPENSVSPAISSPNQKDFTKCRCSSPSSNGDNVLASCCSSNGSSEPITEDDLKVIDLEDEGTEDVTSLPFNGSRETTSKFCAVSDEMESTSKQPEAKPCSRITTAEKTMPSEAEMEEFFAAAERNIMKRLTEKYNFDFVKEVPLEGRYEWVQLNR